MLKAAILIAGVFLLAACGRAPAVEAGNQLDFDYARLAGPLGSLSDADRKTVEDTVALMKQGENKLALVRLAALNNGNQSNASLRLLTSYALLQLGNLAESLAEAQHAHEAAGHGVYQCYVLAHVAAINGNKELARREIGHVRDSPAPELRPAMDALEKRIEAR